MLALISPQTIGQESSAFTVCNLPPLNLVLWTQTNQFSQKQKTAEARAESSDAPWYQLENL